MTRSKRRTLVRQPRPRSGSAAERLPLLPACTVCVIASSDDITPLADLLARVPEESRLAFVVLLDPAKTGQGALGDALAGHSALPIVEAGDDGGKVVSGRIHVVRPGTAFSFQGGRLHVETAEGSAAEMLLSSLAGDQGPASAAIFLSGDADNGKAGAAAIRRAGGLVVAQSPREAAFPARPLSVILAGHVSAVAAPSVMVDLLIRHGDDVQVRLPDQLCFLDADDPVHIVQKLLRNRFGADLSLYKPALITRRIRRRAGLRQCARLAEYASLLMDDPLEQEELYRDLLVGVTSFCRDPEGFATLARDVVPGLCAQMSAERPIRIWIAAGATGEEAYSIVMLFAEQARRMSKPLHLAVFSTDLHPASIMIAEAGFYPDGRMISLTSEQVERYFQRHGDYYRVVDEIREVVQFSLHNLLDDPPFTKIDLLCCRNLLVSFGESAHRNVLAMFRFALGPQGFLFLGPTESPGEMAQEFETISAEWRIFRRRLPERRVLPFPLTPAPAAAETLAVPQEAIQRGGFRHLALAWDLLLARFAPPSFLIGPFDELLHMLGRTDRFLRLARGRPGMPILDLLPGSLKLASEIAIERARREQTKVVLPDQIFDDGEHAECLTILAEPVSDHQATRGYLLLSFAPAGQDFGQAAMPRHAPPGLPGPGAFLPGESVLPVKERLRPAAEAGLRDPAGSSMLDRLLDDMGTGFLVLNAQLQICQFSPLVGRIFNLHSSDLGASVTRVLRQIDHRLELDDIRASIERRRSMEREVGVGRTTLRMRVLAPLHDMRASDTIGVTFVDISERRRLSLRLQRAERAYRQLLAVTPAAVVVLDRFLNVIDISSSGLSLLGLARDAVIGRSWLQHLCAASQTPVQTMLEEKIDPLSPLAHLQAQLVSHGGDVLDVELAVRAVVNVAGAIEQFHVAVFDLGPKLLAERQLQAQLEGQRAAHDEVFGVIGQTLARLKKTLRGIENLRAWIEADIVRDAGHGEIMAYLDELSLRTRLIDKTIDDVLDLVMEQDQDLAPSLVDLGQLLQSVDDRIKPAANLALVFDPGMPLVMVNRNLLTTFLRHLIAYGAKRPNRQMIRMQIQVALDQLAGLCITTTAAEGPVADAPEPAAMEDEPGAAPARRIHLAVMSRLIERQGGQLQSDQPAASLPDGMTILWPVQHSMPEPAADQAGEAD